MGDLQSRVAAGNQNEETTLRSQLVEEEFLTLEQNRGPQRRIGDSMLRVPLGTKFSFERAASGSSSARRKPARYEDEFGNMTT